MKLTKPVEEYTLRELLLAIKEDGRFRARRVATNHVTEANGQPFEGYDSPIDLSKRKLGDVTMDKIMTHIPIRLLGTIKFVGDKMILTLMEFVQEHNIEWPIEISCDTK
jgi:hypothetical protein